MNGRMLRWREESSGLDAVVWIEDTTLGPAAARCRMRRYASEEEALADAKGMARAGAIRAAVAGCDFGGAAVVINGDPEKDKKEALLRALGMFVEELHGEMFLVPDMGTSPEDMLQVWKETEYVCCLPVGWGSGRGSAAALTARGMMRALRACCRQAFGTDGMEGLRVAVQGTGDLGMTLAELLMEERAEVVVTDVCYDKIKELQDRYESISIVRPSEILSLRCDILCPCAEPLRMEAAQIEHLRCKVLAPGADEAVAGEEAAEAIAAKGVLYAPEFVTTAGELYHVEGELLELDERICGERADKLFGLMLEIFSEAGEKKVTPYRAAMDRGSRRVDSIRRMKEAMSR